MAMTPDTHPDPDAQYEAWATDLLLRHEQGPHDPAACPVCQGRWTLPDADTADLMPDDPAF